MSSLYVTLRDALSAHYEVGEAKAIAFLLLEKAFGITRTDIYADKVRYFSTEEERQFGIMLKRLSEGEPVQYVLGEADFCGMTFIVTPSTLIPRPETEELVGIAAQLVSNNDIGTERLKILDAGTGSGCIAISLARLFPLADVEAWDISAAALEVARQNAARLGASVRFKQCDMLSALPPAGSFDLIISNPPYITESEKRDMATNVTGHEPAEALFVPNEEPLRFYRALATLAVHTLRRRGRIAVETNRKYTNEVAHLFSEVGLQGSENRTDAFGNQRFAIAHKG